MSLCPCGSQHDYQDCCALFIEQHQLPQTPEQLMRSRYTAYTLAQIDYIKQSMSDKASIGFDEAEAKRWSQKVIWIGLEVLHTSMSSPQQGFVEFCAQYIDNNQLNAIHERSEFRLKQNKWFYVDGTTASSPTPQKQKIMRNDPCPCNSGKKFKNCHLSVK
jgi:SEC-C motif-containing protein